MFIITVLPFTLLTLARVLTWKPSRLKPTTIPRLKLLVEMVRSHRAQLHIMFDGVMVAIEPGPPRSDYVGQTTRVPHWSAECAKEINNNY